MKALSLMMVLAVLVGCSLLSQPDTSGPLSELSDRVDQLERRCQANYDRCEAMSSACLQRMR